LLLVRDTIGPVVDSDDTVLFAGIHCPAMENGRVG
jgi:hypothetical protein